MILSHPESVGVANPGVEVEIHDPFGEAMAEGEVGEIWMRSASIFIGYWNNPDATKAVLDDEGWYHTGDFGRISDGRLYLESRMRDLIIRGGENIYPMEIEHRLVEHPKVRDAAVIGVDHKELGQEVKASRRTDRGGGPSPPRRSRNGPLRPWPASRCPPTWSSATPCPTPRAARSRSTCSRPRTRRPEAPGLTIFPAEQEPDFSFR